MSSGSVPLTGTACTYSAMALMAKSLDPPSCWRVDIAWNSLVNKCRYFNGLKRTACPCVNALTSNTACEHGTEWMEDAWMINAPFSWALHSLACRRIEDIRWRAPRHLPRTAVVQQCSAPVKLKGNSSWMHVDEWTHSRGTRYRRGERRMPVRRNRRCFRTGWVQCTSSTSNQCRGR